MAKTKVAKDLQQMSLDDLKKKVGVLSEEKFRLRCSLNMGQVTDKLQIRRTRRDLARVKTILTLREKEGHGEKK